jgi:hypothetical protein
MEDLYLERILMVTTGLVSLVKALVLAVGFKILKVMNQTMV